MDTEILFTFPTTSDAIRGEQALLGAGIPVRVMNLPSAIRAGCGICLRVAQPDAVRAKAVLAAGGVTLGGLYARTVANGQTHYQPWPGKEAL